MSTYPLVILQTFPQGNKLYGNPYLRITLTEDGKQECTEWYEDRGDDFNGEELFHNLLEYELCNSDWELVGAEELGALTSNPYLLSQEVERNEEGELTKVGKVFYYNYYVLRDPVYDMIQDGYVDFWCAV